MNNKINDKASCIIRMPTCRINYKTDFAHFSNSL